MKELSLSKKLCTLIEGPLWLEWSFFSFYAKYSVPSFTIFSGALVKAVDDRFKDHKHGLASFLAHKTIFFVE